MAQFVSRPPASTIIRKNISFSVQWLTSLQKLNDSKALTVERQARRRGDIVTKPPDIGGENLLAFPFNSKEHDSGL